MTAHPRRATAIVADRPRPDDPSTGAMPVSGGLNGTIGGKSGRPGSFWDLAKRGTAHPVAAGLCDEVSLRLRRVTAAVVEDAPARRGPGGGLSEHRSRRVSRSEARG
ncbi:hypothetical protein GCM10009687_78920 [Asanoa iriomotensis]|uniref:Uncharacterized protein n=1 Tax=Asanoa iriomotensis TaxID=234613 RepID=A0ABQ4CFY6_9ACTN|nr:hypothetical protein Air01nite_77840 [Asanoa iriomotensis]